MERTWSLLLCCGNVTVDISMNCDEYNNCTKFQFCTEKSLFPFFVILLFVRKWFEPRSSIPWLKKIIWVIGVLRRTVVSDWRFDNLCGSHLQSQVVVLVSWKFKNPGERFDWSIDRVAVGKYVMWLAVKTCAAIGYANRWIVKWIINKVLLFPVE